MRIAYFDCFSGASGDMILGACLDAGLALETLHKKLAGLKVSGYRLSADKIRKQGFAATQFDVALNFSEDQPHRHLHHIQKILDESDLSTTVRERALAIFTRLAEAEAQAHGTTIEKVHFHEVGAVDAIVDIVGACIALDELGVERVTASAIPTGSGTVKCEHGVMPVPAPATAALLQGVPLADCDEVGELTTPTGAAILTTLATRFGPMPGMTIQATGIGAGRRDGRNRPNILRLLIGEANEAVDPSEQDTMLVLEANLDDLSPEIIGYVQDRLFHAGAVDVFTVPIFMKKNRPATLISVIAPPERREAIEDLLFLETTTFGVRSTTVSRRKLARSHEEVDTGAGTVRIKVGRRGDRIVTAAPEYEDCRRVAEATGRPLRAVMNEAMNAWNARPSGA